MINISEKEIRERMQKLRNYEHILYPGLKERSDKLRIENKKLKERVKILEKENKQIEKLLLELEELKEMIYGRKQVERKKEKIPVPFEKKEERVKRTPSSYRRPEPKPEEITGEIRYSLPACPDCGGELIKTQEHISYREDFEGLDILLKQAKKVTRRIIESGYCETCRKRKSAIKIPQQKVVIGMNTKATIVYLHVLLGLSYKETEECLKIQYNMPVSEGMITLSLEEQADLLRPYYLKLYQGLQKEKGCHYDESSWDVQKTGEGNYVWVKTGTESNNVIFWFGKCRGKGVAEKLRGNLFEQGNENQVGISDDYGGYRNIFKKHQLCWAHPNRKLRDLAESGVLEKNKRDHCVQAYTYFAKIYKRAREIKEQYDSGKYNENIKSEILKLKKDFSELTMPDANDPEKLKRIREKFET